MTKIILIRHGQTKWNLEGKYQGYSDVELTEAGVEQAKKVAGGLWGEKITAVYSSDLERAYQTARFIAFDRGLGVEKLQELREINFGEWEGMTYEGIRMKWPDELKQLFASADTVQIPKGETIQAVVQRMSQVIKALVERHPNQTIVLVSHGMAIRCAISHFMHIPLRYVWNIRQDNTAVNIISFYANDHAILELLNDTHHLR